jgi:hypothetical protein
MPILARWIPFWSVAITAFHMRRWWNGWSETRSFSGKGESCGREVLKVSFYRSVNGGVAY